MYAQAMDKDDPPRDGDDLERAPLRWDRHSEDRPADEAAADAEAAGGGIVGHLQSVAEPMATAMEPIVSRVVVPMAGAIGSVIQVANTAISGRSTAERKLRRLNRRPLAGLYDLHPEARQASPRELGLRFVPLEDIRGTAVAGGAQRGGDFLPLRPFRGENWQARWRRIQAANERLQPLPPVDLIKFGGSYWVLDGHNRVAASLYAGGAGLDAMVTELVPLDGHSSELATDLAGLLSEAGELRAAAAGHRPAFAIRYGDQHVPERIEDLDAGDAGTPSAGTPSASPSAGTPSRRPPVARRAKPVED